MRHKTTRLRGPVAVGRKRFKRQAARRAALAGQVSLRRENPDTLESETDTNEATSNMSACTSSESSGDDPMAPESGLPDDAVEQVKQDLAGIRIVADEVAMDESDVAGGRASSGGELPATTGQPVTFDPAAQPQFVHKLPLEVNFDYARELRQRWLMEARKAEEAGELSAIDLHIIKWYLVGDPEVFYPETFPAIMGRRFRRKEAGHDERPYGASVLLRRTTTDGTQSAGRWQMRQAMGNYSDAT